MSAPEITTFTFYLLVGNDWFPSEIAPLSEDLSACQQLSRLGRTAALHASQVASRRVRVVARFRGEVVGLFTAGGEAAPEAITVCGTGADPHWLRSAAA